MTTNNSKSCLKSCQSLSYLKELPKYDFGLSGRLWFLGIKYLRDPAYDVTCISAKILDGGMLADL
jgi:hypothetical protein